MTQANGFQTYTAADASAKVGLSASEVEKLAKYMGMNPQRLSGLDVEKLTAEKKKLNGKSVASYINAEGKTPVIKEGKESEGSFDAKQANVLALRNEVQTIAEARNEAGLRGVNLANVETQSFLGSYSAQREKNSVLEKEVIRTLNYNRNTIISQTLPTDLIQGGDSDQHFLSQFVFDISQVNPVGLLESEKSNPQ